MRAGPLDRRLTVQRKQTIQAANGEPLEVWADLSPTVWAQRREQRGGEPFEGGFSAVREVSYVVRAGVDVTVEDRVVEAGVTYGVVEIRPHAFGRNDGQELFVRHVQARDA